MPVSLQKSYKESNMVEEQHICVVCGWVYEGSELDEGVAWNDLHDDFDCPECGVGKQDFEVI